jgi:hypothetical protein
VISGADAMLLHPATNDASPDIRSIGAKNARLNERPERTNRSHASRHSHAEETPNAREVVGQPQPRPSENEVQICSQLPGSLVQLVANMPMGEHVRLSFTYSMSTVSPHTPAHAVGENA